MAKRTATAEQMEQNRAVIQGVKDRGGSRVQFGKIGWFYDGKRCTGLSVRFSAVADLTPEDCGYGVRFEPIEAIALW